MTTIFCKTDKLGNAHPMTGIGGKTGITTVQNMSRVVRKPAFCICENKGADQPISAFVFTTRKVQPLFFLNPKFQASHNEGHIDLCLFIRIARIIIHVGEFAHFLDVLSNRKSKILHVTINTINSSDVFMTCIA